MRKHSVVDKKVFGVRIDPRSNHVPEYLELWLNILETDLNVEGLFRVSGSNVNINKIRNAIDNGERVDYVQYTAHDIAGVVKLYFRELPVPLVPVELYDCFIAASLTKNENESCNVEKIQKVVKLLPNGHRCVLFRLTRFFSSLAHHSDKNKMSIENLATVVAPNLFRHPLEATNIELVVADFPLQIKIFYTIIANHATIFKGYVAGMASEDTLEKVHNFKKLIEDQYAVGAGATSNAFANKMKDRYAAYRVVTSRQMSVPETSQKLIAERYERIKTGKMTYEETKKLLEALLKHWHSNLNAVPGAPPKLLPKVPPKLPPKLPQR